MQAQLRILSCTQVKAHTIVSYHRQWSLKTQCFDLVQIWTQMQKAVL